MIVRENINRREFIIMRNMINKIDRMRVDQ